MHGFCLYICREVEQLDLSLQMHELSHSGFQVMEWLHASSSLYSFLSLFILATLWPLWIWWKICKVVRESWMAGAMTQESVKNRSRMTWHMNILFSGGLQAMVTGNCKFFPGNIMVADVFSDFYHLITGLSFPCCYLCAVIISACPACEWVCLSCMPTKRQELSFVAFQMT